MVKIGTEAQPGATAVAEPPSTEQQIDKIVVLEEGSYYAEILVGRYPDGLWRQGLNIGHTIGEGLRAHKPPMPNDDGYVTRDEAVKAAAGRIIRAFGMLPGDAFKPAVEQVALWVDGMFQPPVTGDYSPLDDNLDSNTPDWCEEGFASAEEVEIPIRASVGVAMAIRVAQSPVGKWHWGLNVAATGEKHQQHNLEQFVTEDSPSAASRVDAIRAGLRVLQENWRSIDTRTVMDFAKFAQSSLPQEAKLTPAATPVEAERLSKPNAKTGPAITGETLNKAVDATIKRMMEPEPATAATTPTAEQPQAPVEETATQAPAKPEPEPAKPEAEKPKPEQLTPEERFKRAVQKYRHELRESERRVAEAALYVSSAKAQVKAAKEEFENATEELAALKFSGEPEFETYLPSEEHVAAETMLLDIAGGPATVAVTVEKPMAAAPDAWRSVTMATLGLTPGLVETLKQNPSKPIVTLGDLADWTAAGRQLTEIAKVGPVKVEAIQAATEKFWREHPEFTR